MIKIPFKELKYKRVGLDIFGVEGDNSLGRL